MTASHAPELMRGPPPRVRARAHSRLVRTMRWALPMAMVTVIAVLAGMIGAHAIKRQAASAAEATPIRMVNPHFVGRDNKDRAYTLSARQASRDDQDFQKVLLQYPAVTLDVDGAHPSTLTADMGVYREDTRILVLNGHVRADDAKSSSFSSDQAVVNTRTGEVSGPGALASQTPLGQVAGNSYEVKDKGDRVVIKGGVRARLNQH
ncbi:MAG TPA: LPS export ABC transporter periplasmic protein LptC [Caulobacteraceae bacterium]|nr:LPS export ABC transporter periplasmic protein LptC [Caulobacteraceae bacterium]